MALLALLASCGCEDMNLGKLEQSGELNAFLPAVLNKDLQISLESKKGTVRFNQVGGYSPPQKVPVKKTGQSRIQGKGAVYNCMEYYAIEQKRQDAYLETESFPLSIAVILSKNISPEGYSTIVDKDRVADVLHFQVGYYNKFPEPVTRGMSQVYGYLPMRTFPISKKPDQLINKKNSFVQEYLPQVRLNGVSHEKVYHLYLQEPQFSENEQFLNKHYPLTYIQGIYVKEGFGLLQAYTSTGQRFNFSLL